MPEKNSNNVITCKYHYPKNIVAVAEVTKTHLDASVFFRMVLSAQYRQRIRSNKRLFQASRKA